MKSYRVEDIFEDDPDNSDNVLLTIPPDIIEKTGWVENTKLEYEVKDKVLILRKVDNG
jgi:hypothetical protein